MMSETCAQPIDRLADFARGCLLPDEEAAIFWHVFGCKACQRLLREVLEEHQHEAPDPFQFSEQERLRLETLIRQLVAQSKTERQQQQAWWTALSQWLSVAEPALAAADDQTADQKQVKLALQARTITFVALCDPSHPTYWKARMDLPPAPTAETHLVLEVMDARNQPVSSAVLLFCGIEFLIEEGFCRIPLMTLRMHLKKQSIALRDASGAEMEGQLELFAEESERADSC